ncbi:MAG: hypothetical protein LBR22_06065 [Desulfovibrio sp.]|jgi:hypothetical protein|nr:hypothetical protein [Desulfovibrio sp.]
MNLEMYPMLTPDGKKSPSAARNLYSTDDKGPILTNELLERSMVKVYDYAQKTGLFQSIIDSDMCDDGEPADV